LAAVVVLGCATANAAPGIRLRMAAIAPEGTGWAREIHALSRDVAEATAGAVELKWYLGAIAGDELTVLDRIQRGQLDGTAGALFCQRLAPSLRAMRIPALVQTRDEHSNVLGQLRTQIDQEFDQSGFVDLGIGGFGADILFTRSPVRSLAELQQQRLWVWDADEVLRAVLDGVGLRTVPLTVEQAAAAWDNGKLDGYVAVPTAALGYQWSTRTHYFADLHVAFLPGCIVVAKRAFDQLTFEQRTAVKAASAKFVVRFEDYGRAADDKLLGSLFEKNGLKRVSVSESFRSEFYAAAKKAHQQIGTLVPAALRTTITQWLTAFRAHH
jgi:TRAP-type C4-dicarboxylate transport system substrate-binding protein